MGFLNPCRLGGCHAQFNVTSARELAAISTNERCGPEAGCTGEHYRANEVRAAATGAENDQQIARISECFNLSLEDCFKAKIITGTGDGGRITECERGERAA